MIVYIAIVVLAFFSFVQIAAVVHILRKKNLCTFKFLIIFNVQQRENHKLIIKFCANWDQNYFSHFVFFQLHNNKY